MNIGELFGSFDHEDLNTIAGIGNAFWTDPQQSERSVLETFSAVLIQDLTPERALEKAVAALLERAKRGGNAKNSSLNVDLLLQPFFRLSFEERLVLVTLYVGRWSYNKLAKLLQWTPERVQEVAWGARLQVASSTVYPSGSTRMTPYCPEYDPKQPWTQRYLDQEIESVRDRIFLQSHLLDCESCNACFLRSRDIYYQAEKEVTRTVGEYDYTPSLKQMLNKTMAQIHPVRLTLIESLAVFISRPEVGWGVTGLIIWILFLILR